MKDEVLKRGMFSQPMSKSARNSGIMEGFEDEMEDEGTPPLARSPQNPEILMNNLRGDMRSGYAARRDWCTSAGCSDGSSSDDGSRSSDASGHGGYAPFSTGRG